MDYFDYTWLRYCIFVDGFIYNPKIKMLANSIRFKLIDKRSIDNRRLYRMKLYMVGLILDYPMIIG